MTTNTTPSAMPAFDLYTAMNVSSTDACLTGILIDYLLLRGGPEELRATLRSFQQIVTHRCALGTPSLTFDFSYTPNRGLMEKEYRSYAGNFKAALGIREQFTIVSEITVRYPEEKNDAQ